MTEEERREAIEDIEWHLEAGYIDMTETYDKNEFEIIKEAMSSLGALAQYKWERDIAIMQLETLGISFAEKIDGVYLTMEEYGELLEKAR